MVLRPQCSIFGSIPGFYKGVCVVSWRDIWPSLMAIKVSASSIEYNTCNVLCNIYVLILSVVTVETHV